MAGPGSFLSEFRANSERNPSSEQIPGKFRADSVQIPGKHHSVERNLLGWLTTRNTFAKGPGRIKIFTT